MVSENTYLNQYNKQSISELSMERTEKNREYYEQPQ